MKPFFLKQTILFLLVFIFVPVYLVAETPSIKVGTFQQEISTLHKESNDFTGKPFDFIACAGENSIVLCADHTLFHYDGNQLSEKEKPCHIVKNQNDTLMIYSGNQIAKNDTTITVGNIPAETIYDIAFYNESFYLATDQGLYQTSGNQWEAVNRLNRRLRENQSVYCIAVLEHSIVIGAEEGLFQQKENQRWERLYPQDEKKRSWAPRHVRGVIFDNQDRLWFASPHGVGCYDGEWNLYTGEEGLPYNDFTCIAAGPKGTVWFGTTKGVIRFDGDTWAYRQGKRWLPNDHVTDISITKTGDAWIATNDGVGLIQFKPMTLAEKASFYEDEIERYIKRTEYGYTSEVHLRKPGDRSEIIKTDSDNDGLWTGMYGAGECFAYAATKDPKAKERAKQAFEALRFLSLAPIDGEVEQQPGFVARTVVPTTEPDPNKRSGYTIEGQKQRKENEDHLWKVYYPRWPLTKDKNYWYKTDTSSDELDGHYFFYALYHDLVAETEAEKERVREIVRAITDHLIRNDFCLVDHDGKPTRWAIFSPTILNGDPVWFHERGLNSLSMLSYLTVAEHLTGDPKYGEIASMLMKEHHYDINALVPKVQYGIGSANQSDDEMAFMSFYNLIHYTNNEMLKREMIHSFYNYWVMEFPEVNPFFNFAFASCGLGVEYDDPWGDYRLNPWDGWLIDSVQTLTGFPLDRLNWGHQNSHRLDIVRLPPQAASYPIDPPRNDRGYRVNGKVLPVEERHFNHWNTDPWRLDYGGNGTTLASGAVYLLPYYMGLYHGYIQ